MSVETDGQDNTEELLYASLVECLAAAIDTVVAAEEKAKQANIERKAARNKFAEMLQRLGVTGFQMGG